MATRHARDNRRLALTTVVLLVGALIGVSAHVIRSVANPTTVTAFVSSPTSGVDAPIQIEIDGHVGYYCAGMNKQAKIIVNGNAGQGVAENIMSGFVHVKGDASQAAGATGCGGMLVIDGNASARCGISMKGVDIVVKGSVGHMSAFMAQAGNLVVLGVAGDAKAYGFAQDGREKIDRLYIEIADVDGERQGKSGSGFGRLSGWSGGGTSRQHHALQVQVRDREPSGQQVRRRPREGYAADRQPLAVGIGKTNGLY